MCIEQKEEMPEIFYEVLTKLMIMKNDSSDVVRTVT